MKARNIIEILILKGDEEAKVPGHVDVRSWN